MAAILTGVAVIAIINNGEPVPCHFKVEREHVNVTTEREPDPDWTFVDAAGHWHARDDEGNFPTLRREERFIRCDCDYCQDGGEVEEDDDEEVRIGYSTSVYACVLCAEEIKPGTQPGTPKTIPGLRTASVDLPVDLEVDTVHSIRVESEGRVLGFGVARVLGVDHEFGIDRHTATSHLVFERFGSRVKAVAS